MNPFQLDAKRIMAIEESLSRQVRECNSYERFLQCFQMSDCEEVKALYNRNVTLEELAKAKNKSDAIHEFLSNLFKSRKAGGKAPNLGFSQFVLDANLKFSKPSPTACVPSRKRKREVDPTLAQINTLIAEQKETNVEPVVEDGERVKRRKVESSTTGSVVEGAAAGIASIGTFLGVALFASPAAALAAGACAGGAALAAVRKLTQ